MENIEKFKKDNNFRTIPQVKSCINCKYLKYGFCSFMGDKMSVIYTYKQTICDKYEKQII
jgi:hypothetical protein